MNRDQLQEQVAQWVSNTFGAYARTDASERMRRLLEEALELARAEGFTESEITQLMIDVYAKPKGAVRDEVGDMSVTLLAYCAAINLSAAQIEDSAVKALITMDPATTISRQSDKSARGLGRSVRGMDCT